MIAALMPKPPGDASNRTPYQAAVQRLVLDPIKIFDMGMATNTLVQRQPNEVAYYGPGAYVWNVARMSSHGGWIATASDLARFAWWGVNLLNDTMRTSLRTVTKVSQKARYAKGWMVADNGNLFHGGSLPGTSSYMVRTVSGFTWCFNTNIRPQSEEDKAQIFHDLDRLGWRMIGTIPSWSRRHDPQARIPVPLSDPPSNCPTSSPTRRALTCGT